MSAILYHWSPDSPTRGEDFEEAWALVGQIGEERFLSDPETLTVWLREPILERMAEEGISYDD